ncbi:MAG: ABC transporter permease [Chryseolinea sp.]
MFKNYFKTTIRHLFKSKVNFAFKLGGLTAALFSVLVIVIYVSFQMSFDTFHEDHRNIYRVNSNRYVESKMEKYAMVPPGIGPALKAEFPEIQSFVRLSSDKVLIRYNEKLLKTSGLVQADSSLFDVFNFNFIKGDKRSLGRPGTIILTQSLAEKIFSDEDPIGKLIVFADKSDQTAEVTGVIEDLPPNTHLFISALIPMNTDEKTQWVITWDGSVSLYVKLHQNADPAVLAGKAQSLLNKNIAKTQEGSEKNFSIFLQSISNIHLGSVMSMEFHEKGQILYVYIFLTLGFFLVIIAGINYVNLAIADFRHRSKEIGVRKILGAQKRQIAVQVAMESTAFCLLALLLALLLLYFVFPSLLQFLDPRLSLRMLMDRNVITAVIVIIVFLVLFSTAYPAIQLGLNKPLGDLKNISGLGRKPSTARTLLVVQFAISIICISATVIINGQIEFMKTKDLGYDRHNVVTLVMPEQYPTEKAATLKSQLANLQGVEAVSFSYYHMTGVPYFKGWYKIELNGEMKALEINEVFVDHDYLRLMNIELVEGRNFDVANVADRHSAFIVNETAVRNFGWTAPIGKRISVGVGEQTGQTAEGTVIGVVKDFNTRSLRDAIEPLVIRLPYDAYLGYALNIKAFGDVRAILPAIKSTYETVLPGFLADYRIVEEMYDKQYENENKALNALQMGTWIIVLISSLGVFSLSIYLSMKWMKEFGIRKVVGASSWQISFLHVSHFLKLALLANIVALPVAYWLMNQWLDTFAYKIQVNGLVFLAVAIISFILVAVSAGYSSFKAGRMNPVDVIKGQ